MNFHEKLKKLTELSNRSAICRAAGLHETTISGWIYCETVPQIDTAFKIAKVLNVSLDWLADDSKDWPPIPLPVPPVHPC